MVRANLLVEQAKQMQNLDEIVLLDTCSFRHDKVKADQVMQTRPNYFVTDVVVGELRSQNMIPFYLKNGHKNKIFGSQKALDTKYQPVTLLDEIEREYHSKDRDKEKERVDLIQTLYETKEEVVKDNLIFKYIQNIVCDAYEKSNIKNKNKVINSNILFDQEQVAMAYFLSYKTNKPVVIASRDKQDMVPLVSHTFELMEQLSEKPTTIKYDSQRAQVERSLINSLIEKSYVEVKDLSELN